MSAVVDTLTLTAEEALGLVDRGDVSAAELHGAYLDAIGERDDELHSFLRTVDGADGTSIPIALKDVISTRGVETTAGSRILSGYVPVFDATVTARCRAAGLTLLGKTNTDEFAMGSSTENSAYGPTRNPWNLELVPGGSGGGTAAAVSAGLAPWGLGSDTGGSIKQPSALCGNVGLRPTYGTVSRYGVVAFASSLDQVGPVAKTVRDVALLYRVIAGRDTADSTTVELQAQVELRPTSGSTACGSACPGRRSRSRRSSPACARHSRRRSPWRRSSAPTSGNATCRSRSTTGCPATTSSRRPRRRPTSPATTASGTGRAARGRRIARCSSVRATRASATSPSGGSCSARTPSRPATTTRITDRRKGCARSSCGSTRAPSRRSTCSRHRRRRPSRSRSGTRPPTRSRCTRATSSRSRPALPGCPG